MKKKLATLMCVFCDKNQNDVRKLIAHTPGPGRPDLPMHVAICDGCLADCNYIMQFERRYDGPRAMLAADIGA